MMPLALANIGEEYMIRRVSGNPEVKKHLEDRKSTRLNSSHSH